MSVNAAWLGVFILALFVYGTATRNEVWQDPITLQEDIYRKSPNKHRVILNLAVLYVGAGRADEAIALYGRLLHELPDIGLFQTTYRQAAASNLAAIYLDRYQLDLAEPLLRDNQQLEARVNYAVLLMRRHRHIDALFVLDSIPNKTSVVLLNRGMLYQGFRQCDLANQDFEAAYRLDPSMPRLHCK